MSAPGDAGAGRTATDDDLIAAAAALVADIDRERAEVAEETAAARRRGAERFAEVEQARRAGEHGRDWQVLQQRIDLRETSDSDILNGLDHSAEARAVRAVMGEHFALVRRAYRRQLADPDPALAGSLAQLAGAREELSAELSRLAALDRDNR